MFRVRLSNGQLGLGLNLTTGPLCGEQGQVALGVSTLQAWQSVSSWEAA